MCRRGFSVIELVVVIGIISILLSVATLDFGAWQRRALVERYTKELYADVQNARMRAVFTKLPQRVEFSAQQVKFRSFSSSSDVVGTVTATKKLPVAVTTNFSAAPQSNQVIFDTRGIDNDVVIKVICFATTEDAAYDAVIITPALTSMGKRTDRGSNCARTNVTQK
jgi:type IV fimbrial biogenesis protein FimT